MKKYGVKNKEDLKVLACCSFSKYIDSDNLFGTDDLNIAYRYIEHCGYDEALTLHIFEKSSGELITK